MRASGLPFRGKHFTLPGIRHEISQVAVRAPVHQPLKHGANMCRGVDIRDCGDANLRENLSVSKS